MNDEENERLDKELGITPITKINDTVANLMADAHNDSATIDFETARANVLNVIENLDDAMHKLAEIAHQSQHPRAYEVFAKLAETSLSANKDLMDLQRKIREIKSADEPMSGQAKTINNNMFVGSTAELQKMIEGMKK